MPTCASINCKNRQVKGSGKTFHKFPKSRPNIMKQWLVNVGTTNYKLSKLAVLCSDHFKESCFDKTGQTTRLRDEAVPTIFEFSKHLTREEEWKPPVCCTPEEPPPCMPSTVAPAIPTVTMSTEASPPLPVSSSTAQAVTLPQLDNTSQNIIPIKSLRQSNQEQDHTYHVDNLRILKDKCNTATVIIEQMVKKLKCTQQQRRRLMKKVTRLESIITNLENERLALPLDTLRGSLTDLHLQLLERIVHLPNRTITEEEFPPDICKFALTLQACSIKAYEHVRDSLGLTLPCQLTTSQEHSECIRKPGSMDEMVDANDGEYGCTEEVLALEMKAGAANAIDLPLNEDGLPQLKDVVPATLR
uniref:THAP domain-containing protein 1-like isoform X1 n=2 Tax=Myxine glutinosa TaxID=7769 RepID=UPI00358E3B11